MRAHLQAPYALVATLAFFACVTHGIAETPAAGKAPASAALTQAIEKNLELVRKALTDEKVVTAVSAANSAHANLTADAIKKLDDRWRQSEGIDDYVKPYLTGPCAQRLRAIQDENDGLAEIFITDSVGLNVCQTNKTSDLYQADEQWWKDAWNGGSGRRYHGEVEHDESAGVDAISAYDVLRDAKTGAVTGVIKVVIDVTGLKKDT